MIRALLTQRIVLLAVLLVLVVVYFMVLGATGYLTAAYDFDYLSAALINAVPLAMLGFAELFVILSGRGGIDLSVWRHRLLAGMIFGFAYGRWGWPLWLAIVITAVVGAVLGLVNGTPGRLHRVPGADRDPRPPTTRYKSLSRGDQQPAADQHEADSEPL